MGRVLLEHRRLFPFNRAMTGRRQPPVSSPTLAAECFPSFATVASNESTFGTAASTAFSGRYAVYLFANRAADELPGAAKL
jgi:hypothetical protein